MQSLTLTLQHERFIKGFTLVLKDEHGSLPPEEPTLPGIVCISLGAWRSVSSGPMVGVVAHKY